MKSTALLDTYGRHLLRELQKDARLPYAELGRRIGLSASATAERIEGMKEAGIIRGFTVDIDKGVLGIQVLAFIRMTCDGPRYQPFLNHARQVPEIRQCHHVTGGDAFVLQVETSSTEALEKLIEQLLRFGSPTTSLVLSSPVVRTGYSIE